MLLIHVVVLIPTNMFQIQKTKLETIKYNILCGLAVCTTGSHTCNRWFDSYLTFIFSSFFSLHIFSDVATISRSHGLNQ